MVCTILDVVVEEVALVDMGVVFESVICSVSVIVNLIPRLSL